MKYIILHYLVFLACSCKAQSCEFEISNNFFNEDLKSDSCIFCRVLAKGLSAIPCLIEAIGVKEKSNVGFYDSNSSNFSEFSQNNYKGIKAAYLIEYLIKSNQNTNCNTLESVKIFGYGVIGHLEGKESKMTPLTYKDIEVIKGLYLIWWKKNKHKSIKEISKEKMNVLGGSNYIWM